MCGIVGVWKPECVTVADEDWVNDAALKLKHRGPDVQSFLTSGDRHATFGHARLAIIDLSKGANQPMTFAHDGSMLIFNGEIYNFRNIRRELETFGYRFRTDSDTEVLGAALQHWGAEACDRLEGMFAFAFYDAQTNALLLGRDRAGQKPLYVHELPDGGLIFSSEIKVLLSYKRDWHMSRAALEDYLRFGYTLGDQSLIDSIRRVRPATIEIWNREISVSHTYWRLPQPLDKSEHSHEQLVDELEFKLEAAVNRTLVSDVPVGILLSGGVDSSVIAALATRTTTSLATYTVSFGDSAFDEASEARQVSRNLGLDHHEIDCSELAFEDFREILLNQDEPIADPSILPSAVLAHHVSQHSRVVLGGDGGDELFAGYLHYRHLMKLDNRIFRFSEAPRRLMARSILRGLPRGQRGQYWIEVLTRSGRGRSEPLGHTFLPHQANSLLNGLWKGALPNQRSTPNLYRSLIDETLEMDFLQYLPNDILQKIDRASMRYSLEVRSPFLDSQVIDFAFSQVPLESKISNLESKILLKDLRFKLLGTRDSLSRKQGFTPPLRYIMEMPAVKDWILEVLAAAPKQIWNLAEVDKWSMQFEKQQRAHLQCFALACVISWQLEHGICALSDE